MATTLSEVDNTCAWGPVVGQHIQFPWLMSKCGRSSERPAPGMLVTSYYGQCHLEATGKLGLGIIVAVFPHPKPRGDVQFRVTVVWNFDCHAYKDAPGKAGPPDWYVKEQRQERPWCQART